MQITYTIRKGWSLVGGRWACRALVAVHDLGEEARAAQDVDGVGLGPEEVFAEALERELRQDADSDADGDREPERRRREQVRSVFVEQDRYRVVDEA